MFRSEVYCPSYRDVRFMVCPSYRDSTVISLDKEKTEPFQEDKLNMNFQSNM